MEMPNSRCRKFRSIREGSVIYGKKYQMRTLYLIYCYWCTDFPKYEITQPVDAGPNTHNIQNLCHAFRQAAIHKYQIYMTNNLLGGQSTVELDESAFGKVKYHRGRALIRNCNWVIKAFEQNIRWVVVITMPNRSKKITKY